MTNTKESTIKVVRDERGRFVKAAPTPRPFKVGDVVRMSREGKNQYDNLRENPHNATGSITGEGNIPWWFGVKWNNGEWNDYLPHHLELVPNAPKQRKAEKKTEAPKFKIGDRVRVTDGQYVPNGTLGTIKGEYPYINGAWLVRYDSGPEPRLRYAMPNQIEKVKDDPRDLDLTVPEEITAALQTLAKAFGYRVEKA